MYNLLNSMKISKADLWDSVTTSLLEMTDRVGMTSKDNRTKAAADEAQNRFNQYKKDHGIKTTEDIVEQFASEDDQKNPEWQANAERARNAELEAWEREQGIIPDGEDDPLLPARDNDPYDGDSYNGEMEDDFAVPENQELLAWEQEQGIELSPLQEAARKPLTEMLHEISEFDGLIGTEDFNTTTPEGLKNILSKLEDIKWKTEMEMHP